MTWLEYAPYVPFFQESARQLAALGLDPSTTLITNMCVAFHYFI